MSRTVTLAGYAVLAAAMAAVQLVAWRLAPGKATLGAVLRWATSWPPVRWVLTAAWLWLGWHLFARVELS